MTPEESFNLTFCLQSTESLVLEVLEELEEFTEREKNFEEKYVKTINQMKSEAEKTELELTKVGTWALIDLHPPGITCEIFSLSQ